MGMQHSTPAPHIIANTALGGQPRTRALLEPDSDAATGNLTVHRPVLPGIVCGTDSFTASYTITARFSRNRGIPAIAEL
jgi:hypothetical protein